MAVKLNGNVVTVEMYDGSNFSYISDFVRNGVITDDKEFGNELREKIYGQ